MIRALDRIGPVLCLSDTLAFFFLAALPLVYFYPVTLGQQVWYGDDILLLWFPFGAELATALRSGRLPLWAPGMMNGFPLFAEGQAGALYPVNLILYRFLPAYWAVAYQNLIHLIWAAWGMYVLVRRYGYGIASAVLAGIIFSFNGFIISHLIHVPFITTLSWLPWLVFLATQYLRARRVQKHWGGWFLVLTLAIAIQLFAGFPQVALLSAMTAILLGLAWCDSTQATKKWCYTRLDVIWLMLPWILGAGIAAVQLIPTLELAQYSERMSALGHAFWTSYALPPDMLAGLFFPQGIPVQGNNEFWNYVGITPIVLAFLALVVQCNGWTIFLAVFALGGILFALGDVNPLFPLISSLPIINYFRAPARYMLFFVMSAILLSAIAFQFLSQRLKIAPISKKHLILATILVAMNLGAIGLVYSQPWDFWLEYRSLMVGCVDRVVHCSGFGVVTCF